MCSRTFDEQFTGAMAYSITCKLKESFQPAGEEGEGYIAPPFYIRSSLPPTVRCLLLAKRYTQAQLFHSSLVERIG